MKDNPVRALVSDLGRQLSQKEHSDSIFPYATIKSRTITSDSFKEIKGIENPKKIAFIDGGDGPIEDSPNFLIVMNRVYFGIFQGKNKLKPRHLKSRVEFFSYVVSNITTEDGKKRISFDAKLYPYNEDDVEYLPSEKDLSLKTEGTTILEKSRVVSLSRRFAEWLIAKKVVEEELQKGDMIVLDGSLQTSFKNEIKYADSLYQAATKKGVIVCGLAKTSRLITESGDPLLARIDQISENVSFPRWYVEVAECVTADDRGFMLAAKFHPKSKHVFRFEVLREQFNKMSDSEKDEVLASLAANASDLSMLGYPYGFVDADRFAQVRKNELKMYKGLIMAEMLRHPEWKDLQRYGFTTKFHDELNEVTS